jgi:eukaryotic-like serine/threonine-protein kinase
MLERLTREIHRRSLWQVLAIFLASGWAVLQVLDTFIDQGLLPAWTFRAGVVLLLLGLPVVLATAFVQEGLPGGSAKPDQRESPDLGGVSPAHAARARSVERSTTHHRLFTWRNAILGGVGAFALLGMGSGGWMAMRVLGVGPVGTLAAQGVLTRGAEVVLADFDSGDEAELGDVVTRTLRIDLMQSRMIRVLDRVQLNAPLERMQAEPGARITNDVAAQLAEREGYAAIITGDVARAGSGYVLTASIRAGDGFVPVAGFRETARNDDELIVAIERLSRKIRDKAGESLRTVQGGASLAQVTTSSLPALREYTRGEALQGTGEYNAAVAHYERAVMLDPTFAMAHRKLAAVLSNLQTRRADVVVAFRRTYELRDRLPPLERELAIGDYMRSVAGDATAAVAAYERALAIDSTSTAIRNNLGILYWYIGRHADAVRQYEAILRVRPLASAYGNLAVTRFGTGDLAGALAVVDSGMAVFPNWKAGLRYRVLFLVARQQFDAAESASRAYEQAATAGVDRWRAAEMRQLLLTYRGRLHAAQRMLDDPLFADDHLTRAARHALTEVMRGDTSAAISRVQQALGAREGYADSNATLEALYVLTHARAGAEASAALSAWRAAVPDDELGIEGRVLRQQATAATQRARRDYDGALRTLEDLRRRWPSSQPFTNLDVAQTYDDMSNADMAIEWYEKALDAYDISVLYAAPQVTRALRRLGELYDAQGNDTKAIEYYARFVELWKDADAELQPLVRASRQRLQALLAQRG